MVFNTLRVSVIETEHILKVKQTPNGYELDRGIESEFLKLIGCGLKLPITVILSNRSYLEPLLLNKADITMRRKGLDEKLFKDFDIACPYAEGDVRFAMKPYPLLSNEFAFVKTFGTRLWITILFLLLFIPLIFYFIFKKKNVLSKLIFTAFAILFKQQQKLNLTSNFRDRVLLLSWLMGAMLIGFAYMSMILSLLTMPKTAKGIDKMDDLVKSVVKNESKCYALDGMIPKNFMVNSNEKNVKFLGNIILERNWILKVSRENILKTIRKDGNAVLLPKLIRNYQIKGLVAFKDSLGSMMLTVVVRKNCPYFEQIKRLVEKIFEMGIYEKIVDDYFFKESLKDSYEMTLNLNEQRNRALNLQEMYSIFIILASGLTLSCIVCFVEIFYNKLKKM